MNQQQNGGNDQSTSNSSEGPEQKNDLKIAANENPRANANINQTAFEKTTKGEDPADVVGTEITDGEGG